MTTEAENQLDRKKEHRAVGWLFAVCGVLMAIGLAIGIDARPNLSPVELGNVMEAQLVEIRDDGGVTVLSGEFRSRTDALGNIEKDAALMDRQGRNVIGEVELEIPAPGRTDRQPELEVDIIQLKPTATYTVFIDDRPVGRFTTDDRGSIDVEIQEGEIPLTPLQEP